MKIYIPKHLRSLKVVDNLCRMIEEYSATTTETSEKKYYNPVEKFLRCCNKKEVLYIGVDEKEADDIWEGKIKYYTNLLYCHKGSLYVLEILKKFLEDECDSEGNNSASISFEYTYDLTLLKIKMNRIPSTNESTFNNYLKILLDNLLYFDNFILYSEDTHDIEVDLSELFKETKVNYNLSDNYSRLRIKYEKSS